ncbi:MAG: hypothetical protein K2Q03_05705 [Sphingobacteriaceae bacterium]|nr:hypothetical protein [Sphingobacteriaceae bacterium]
MRRIEVQYKQTLLDIALQEYGSIDGVYWLVEDNGLDSIIDNVAVGQLLIIRNDVVNMGMRNFLQTYKVSTADEQTQATGIGFWVLEQDFKIQ